MNISEIQKFVHPSKTRPDNRRVYIIQHEIISLQEMTKLFIFKVKLMRNLQPFCIFGEADLRQLMKQSMLGHVC